MGHILFAGHGADGSLLSIPPLERGIKGDLIVRWSGFLRRIRAVLRGDGAACAQKISPGPSFPKRGNGKRATASALDENLLCARHPPVQPKLIGNDQFSKGDVLAADHQTSYADVRNMTLTIRREDGRKGDRLGLGIGRRFFDGRAGR